MRISSSNAHVFRAAAYQEEQMLRAVMPGLATRERVPEMRVTVAEVAGDTVRIVTQFERKGER
jgi:hypothetical protein